MIIFFTIFGTIAVGNLGIKALIKSCIPVISRYYWFISCYFFLCFLTPFLNQIPEKLSKENKTDTEEKSKEQASGVMAAVMIKRKVASEQIDHNHVD